MLKKEIRVIGIDDAPHKFKSKGNISIIGTIFRGGSWLDGVTSTKASIDGNNATEKIAEMINKSRFKPQLQCIFLDGIAVGGFNIIDIKELNKKTKLPVIVIIRKKPDIEKIKKILTRINKESKIKLLEKAGPVIPAGVRDKLAKQLVDEGYKVRIYVPYGNVVKFIMRGLPEFDLLRETQRILHLPKIH